MIEEILPAEVRSAELFGDAPEIVLFPEEEDAISRAVSKRRREFGSARWCARQALAALGHEPVPLVPGERGAPRWPAGIVGSMTHCAEYRAAALARADEVRTVGIDAEPHGELPEGVLEAVTLEAERPRLRELERQVPDLCWDRLLFSAKESVYKAWYPVTGRWLGFEEASVRLDPRGTFHARLLVPDPPVPDGFHGRWLARDGLIITAITVPREPAEPPAGTAITR